MDDDDRVILCNAEPHWISAAIAGERDLSHAANLGRADHEIYRYIEPPIVVRAPRGSAPAPR